MPKISVVMPVYNGEEYLPEAIDSVIGQSYQDWELLIINEFGSNEEATRIVNEYAAKDSRIKVIQNTTRLRIAASMNAGIDAAQGEYIARMDADDICMPLRFEKQLAYMETHPEVFLCGTRQEEFEGTINWTVETDPYVIASNILFYSPCVHPTVMWRKKDLPDLRYNVEYGATEDYDLFSKVCEKGLISNMEETLLRYRIRQTSATQTNNNEGMVRYLEIMNRQFCRLGLEFSQEDLELLSVHHGLKGKDGKEVEYGLLRLDILLKQILTANGQKKLYDPVYLFRTLKHRFEEAYYSLAWTVSWYHQSQVDKIYQWSIFSKESLAPVCDKKSENPLVTVLIPLFRSRDYLPDALQSILRQTFTDFDVMLVAEPNDDPVDDILEVFGDARVKLYRNEVHLGLSESLNWGMRHAHGTYIARLDADDLALPERLARQVEYMQANPECGVCGSWQEHFGVNENWVHRVPEHHKNIEVQLIYNCCMCHSTLMLRKDVFLSNNLYYDTSASAEDFDLWRRSTRYMQLHNIQEVLGLYRVTGQSITDAKMEQLGREESEAVMALLEKNLQIHEKASDYPLTDGWHSPFQLCPTWPKWYRAMRQEARLLLMMQKQNKRLGFYDQEALERHCCRRYYIFLRLAQYDNDWLGDPGNPWKKYSWWLPLLLDYLIQRRLNRSVREFIWEKKEKLRGKLRGIRRFLGRIKRFIKSCLRRVWLLISWPVRKPLQWQLDKVQRMIWDASGIHRWLLNDAMWKLDQKQEAQQQAMKDQLYQMQEEMNRLKAEIDGRRNAFLDESRQFVNLQLEQEKKFISQALQDYMQQMNDHIQHSVNSSVEQIVLQLARSLENQAGLSEGRLTRLLDSRLTQAETAIHQTMDSRIQNAEQLINQTMDTRVRNAEELINQTMDARVWNAEKLINQTMDARVWNAEKLINQTMDARVWNAEKLINQTIDARIWKAELSLSDTASSILNTAMSEYPHPMVEYKPGEKIRIVFLYQVASFWPSWDKLYQSLIQDDRFDVKVLYLDETVSEMSQMASSQAFIDGLCIPYERYEDFDLGGYRPHIMVMQTPYDEWHRMPNHHSAAFKKQGYRIVYIPYGIEITDTETSRNDHFFNSVVNHAWRVYTFSEAMAADYRKYCPNAFAVKALGLPRFDALLEDRNWNIPPKIREKINGRKVVLWKVHFPKYVEEDNQRFLITPDINEYLEFAKHIANNPDLFFVFMPHPKFAESMQDPVFGEQAAELLDLLSRYENVWVDTEDDYRPALLAADYIMTDRSAVMVEAALTEKPVLYMKSAEDPEKTIDAVKPLIDSYYQGTTTNDMIAFIDMCKRGEDPRRDDRINQMKACLPLCDGFASQRIIEDIVRSL